MSVTDFYHAMSFTGKTSNHQDMDAIWLTPHYGKTSRQLKPLPARLHALSDSFHTFNEISKTNNMMIESVPTPKRSLHSKTTKTSEM